MSAPVTVGKSPAPETPGAQQPDGPPLTPQPHGGALLAGGRPGNRGGTGRPKEELRERMRAMLDGAHEAMAAALAGERLAADAGAALLSDPRLAGLSAEVLALIAEVAADHLTATLTTRELIQLHESLARYGVGVQQEVEQNTTAVRYVVRIPSREPAPPRDACPPFQPAARAALPAGAPIAVVPSPGEAPRSLSRGAAAP